jgi:hypothetical protein
MRISFLLYGPRIPLSYLGKDEIVDKGLDGMKNWLSDKIKSCVQYPQSVFIALGDQVLEMQLVVAFKFRLLRKVLYYAWNLQDDVSKITFESGSKDCPIWLDYENISLYDIETITTLLNHKEYNSIESISTE